MPKTVVVKKKDLIYLYKIKKLTSYEIADIYNCCQGTIWKRLEKYKIKRVHGGRNAIFISKFDLKDLYLKQGLSSRKIAKKYNCAYSTVDRKIRQYGFPIKTLAEAHIIYSRKNFNGNKTEKAYLIGFSIGDLRVRKRYHNSLTIHIDCGSTRQEQINLIKSLFMNYGRVWISKPNKRGAKQIECALNKSFSFLLKKRILIDRWILNNNRFFISFLAGFTDAEGSIFVSADKASYSLGNYNKKILSQIRNKLISMRIDCPAIREDKTKGYIDKQGYVRNQNYSHLRIDRKIYLIHLFNLISPYLKHKKRIKNMKKAIKNINLRNRKYNNINMKL